jgi:excisionase family DNA binding protein
MAVMFEEIAMPKKPKKPVPDGLLSIDATPQTAKLNQLVDAKHALMAKHHADPRDAVSVKEATKMLGMSQSRLYELLEAGLIGSYLDGRSRKIIAHSLYLYRIRLLDLAIEVEAQRMDRAGIPVSDEWLTPKG